MMIAGRADRRLIEALVGTAFLSRSLEVTAEQPSRYAQFLKEANVAPEWVTKRCLLFGVAALLGMVTVGVLGAVAAVVVGALLTFLPLMRARKRRRAELDRDFPTLLMTVASSVRAGLDPLTAVVRSREYFVADSILARELTNFANGLTQGIDEGKLIDELFAGVSHPDIELFRSCLALSRRHGTSLADPLHRITRVVRQRQSFRRKIRAALAMHRLSAIGIAGCAVMIGVFQGVTNVKGLMLAWEHPIGGKILITGALVMATGVWWMMSLGKMEEG